MANYKRVALIGLDGSGKSANISAMKNDIDYAGYQFVWVRWKPTLLKPAYWILEKKVTNKNSDEKKKMNAEYHTKSGMKEKIFKNPIIRAVWMFLALIDYFFQFYAKTIKMLLGKKNIIFDRFYLDLFVDQGINFGYSPEKIDSQIKKYQKWFPKVEQKIYIQVSPETCYQRKDDIPNMDYLLKRCAIYERLSQSPGWIIVDGEKPFAEVYKSIKEMIFKEC